MLQPDEFAKYFLILQRCAVARLVLSKISIFGRSVEPCDFISAISILNNNKITPVVDLIKFTTEPILAWYGLLFFLNSSGLSINNNYLVILSQFNRSPIKISLRDGEKIKSIFNIILSLNQNNFLYSVEKHTSSTITIKITNRYCTLKKFTITPIGGTIDWEQSSSEWKKNTAIWVNFKPLEQQNYYELLGMSITEHGKSVSSNYYVLKRGEL